MPHHGKQREEEESETVETPETLLSSGDSPTEAVTATQPSALRQQLMKMWPGSSWDIR